jgi:RNA polymerase sigma-70 factor (ECF subfamily)
MNMKSEEPINDLHQSIRACLPKLRSFSIALARDRTLADDLVQEAIVRALTHRDQFEPNTNFNAWITTIARNCFYNELRRRRRIADVNPELPSLDQTVSGGQEARLEMRDFQRAFEALSTEHREALFLVGASGFSYEKAAERASCAAGTMKSRVFRARAHLQQLLDPKHDELSTVNITAGVVFGNRARGSKARGGTAVMSNQASRRPSVANRMVAASEPISSVAT